MKSEKVKFGYIHKPLLNEISLDLEEGKISHSSQVAEQADVVVSVEGRVVAGGKELAGIKSPQAA